MCSIKKGRGGNGFKNEVGNKYGKLVVEERVENYKGGAKWLCKCDCGKTSKVTGTSLRFGTTKSCGCAIGNERSGEAVYRIMYRNIQKDCKNRNLLFNIELDDIINTVHKNCTYCGRKAYEKKCRYQKPNSLLENDCLIINGIDRVVPSKGYTKGNITSCCKYCNRAKSDLSLEDFKNLITLIFNNYVEINN